MQPTNHFCKILVLVVFFSLGYVVPAKAVQSTTAHKAQVDASSAEQARKETEAIITQLRSDALEAKQRSDAALASPVWKSALTQKREGVLNLEGEVDDFFNGLPSIAEPLKTELPGLTEATRRLVALNEASQNNPVLQKVLFLRALLVSKSLDRQVRPLQTVQGIASRASETVRQLRQGLQDASTASTEEEKQTLQRLVTLEEKTRRLSSAVQTELADANTLQVRLSQIQASILDGLLPMWGTYYLSTPSRIFDMQAWQNMDQWWQQMLFNFPLRLSIELPPTPSAWRSVALNGINALLLAAVLLFFTRSRMRAAIDRGDMSQAAASFTTKSLSCFLVGIAVVFASFGSMEEQYRGLLTAGSIIVIIGEVWLAWGLRCRGEKTIIMPPLWPIAVTSIFGIAVSYPNFPIIILTILWCIFIIGMLLITKKQSKQCLPPLENIFSVAHQVSLYVSFAIALLGWARLAILLIIAVNCLCISVQLIASLMQTGKIQTTGTDDAAPESAATGIISAFIAPIVLLLVIGSMLLWMMAMPGGTLIAWHYLGTGVHIGKASFNLLNIFILLSLFYITRAAIATSRTLLHRWSERSKRVDTSLIPPMQTGIVYGLWTLFALFTLQTFGFGLENLAVIAGGLSVGIGFGMQAIVNNFLSGLILIFSRTLHEGDVIDVGTLQGTVRKISVRATTVETFDNAIIFVPNSEFVSNRLINWTRNGRLVRKEVAVGVAYGTDPKLVETLLLQVATSMDKVSKLKDPNVLFTDFSDSTLNFVLRYWADFDHAARQASDMRHKIVEIFTAHNVEIAFPQLDVHIIPPALKAATQVQA